MKELVLYEEADGTWAVTCNKIPGLVAKGKTQQEAIDNIKKALSIYFPCGSCKSSNNT